MPFRRLGKWQVRLADQARYPHVMWPLRWTIAHSTWMVPLLENKCRKTMREQSIWIPVTTRVTHTHTPTPPFSSCLFSFARYFFYKLLRSRSPFPADPKKERAPIRRCVCVRQLLSQSNSVQIGGVRPVSDQRRRCGNVPAVVHLGA